MAIKDALLAEFDHEMAATRRLLERVPDDPVKLSWKPHEKSMSLGRLATHISHLPVWASSILNEPFFDLEVTPVNVAAMVSRGDILAAFDENATRARTALDKIDGEYEARWALKRGGREMFSLPRALAFRSFVMNHLIHHRGQLSVYLRLNDIPVPALYGPTADEG